MLDLIAGEGKGGRWRGKGEKKGAQFEKFLLPSLIMLAILLTLEHGTSVTAAAKVKHCQRS